MDDIIAFQRLEAELSSLSYRIRRVEDQLEMALTLLERIDVAGRAQVLSDDDIQRILDAARQGSSESDA